MNVVDFNQASAAAKQAISQLQAAGMAITDAQASALHTAIHAALSEASTDASGVIAPLLTELAACRTELAAWRPIIGAAVVLAQRFDGAALHLAPPLPPIPNSTARPAETGKY